MMMTPSRSVQLTEIVMTPCVITSSRRPPCRYAADPFRMRSPSAPVPGPSHRFLCGNSGSGDGKGAREHAHWYKHRAGTTCDGAGARISRHARRDRDMRLVRLVARPSPRPPGPAPPLTLTLTRDLAMARALTSLLPGTGAAQAPHVMVRVRGSVGMRATTATCDWCDSSGALSRRPGAPPR